MPRTSTRGHAEPMLRPTSRPAVWLANTRPSTERACTMTRSTRATNEEPDSRGQLLCTSIVEQFHHRAVSRHQARHANVDCGPSCSGPALHHEHVHRDHDCARQVSYPGDKLGLTRRIWYTSTDEHVNKTAGQR